MPEAGIPAGDTLAALILGIAAGDRGALRAAHGRMANRVYGMALAILRDRAGASDVLQDTFIKVWQRAGQFDPARGTGEAWLLAIARYTALDAARARGREMATDDPLLGDLAVPPEALEALMAGQSHARLRACLERLGAKGREAIVLAFVHGLSHVEVAEQLSLPLGTVKSQIRRGLLALRECMA